MVIIKALDLVTIAVPPALPAAIGIGVVFALSRLKECKIFWISPPWINAAGRVKSIVFDKTGTLTEDSLRFAGVTIANKESFDPIQIDMKMLWLNEESKANINQKVDCKMLQRKCVECMATCHSIATLNGKFIGDPLDVEMFKATDWTLSEKDHEDEDLGEHIKLDTFTSSSSKLDLLKRFEFSSALQRMSVVVKDQANNDMLLFVKGSPEIIQTLSIEDFVPDDYFDILEKIYKGWIKSSCTCLQRSK